MPLLKEDRYTLADALTWDKRERIELIDGAPVMMAPPLRLHQEIITALLAQLYNYLEGKKCKVYPPPSPSGSLSGRTIGRRMLTQWWGLTCRWFVTPASWMI